MPVSRISRALTLEEINSLTTHFMSAASPQQQKKLADIAREIYDRYFTELTLAEILCVHGLLQGLISVTPLAMQILEVDIDDAN